MGFKEFVNKRVELVREARARKMSEVAARNEEARRIKKIKAEIKALEYEEYLKAKFSHSKRIGQARAKHDADLEIQRLNQPPSQHPAPASSSRGFGFEPMFDLPAHDDSLDNMFGVEPLAQQSRKKKR